MITITREEIKADKIFSKLLKDILSHHCVAPHTKDILIKNKHIKDFCEEARHFMIIQGLDLFINYDVSSWFKEPDGVQLRIDAITIYDDFIEYEADRLRHLHGSAVANIPNIN